MWKSAALFFAFALFLTEVSTWTLNSPEVEKYFIERAKQKQEKVFKLNNDLDDDSTYAKEYQYLGYKNKKINGIIVSGSKYLDGLGKALSEYKDIMDRCTHRQLTTARPLLQFLERRSSNEDPCTTVLKNGEYIKRLSEVVMWTTSAMRDKSDNKYKDEDETALIARLAWLLDRLANLTGFEPFEKSTVTEAIEVPDKKQESKDTPLEIMEPVENGRPLPTLPPKHRPKRSTQNPLDEVANYYIKFKAWTNSNPEKDFVGDKSQFDVENNLKIKSIQKRSVKSKKAVDIKVTDNKKAVVLKPELIKAKLILHKLVDIGLKVKDKIKHVKKAIKHV